MQFDKNFVKKALPECEIIFDNLPSQMVNFSIDSRTLKEGEAFIAIIGKNNDGHDFVLQAIKNKASGLIISKKECLKNIDKKILENLFVIIVDDTIKALTKLAKEWRQQFTYPVIGITGSVGKTSTKQIIENILKLNGNNYLATQGNQNSLIGLPLNVLRMREYHTVAVFELGINKRGEMNILVEISQPTIALITVVGHSHMEGLGSILDVAAEKRDVFRLFKENNIGIINGDQPMLSQIGYKHPVVKFGTKITNQIQARKIRIIGSNVNFVLKIYKRKYNVSLPNNHLALVFNSLAAIAAGCLLNISDDIMLKAISIPLNIKGRFEFKNLNVGKGILIDDCYNANPESMKSALLTFEKIKTNQQKIAVLSDMLELGSDSSFWHRQIGRFIRKVPSLNELILVGNMVKFTKSTLPVNLNVQCVSDVEEAIKLLEKKVNEKESLVLVKGSTRAHTSGLVNLVKYFTEETNKVYNKSTTKELNVS